MMALPTATEIIQAQERISAYIHRTPVLTSRLVNSDARAELHFKCENFQKSGSFKMRGAANAILKLSNGQMSNGVLTHSSGNFAQAVALAADSAGCDAHIVMPENAPGAKRRAVEGYGGHIVTSGTTPTAREKLAAEVKKKTGATFLHPSNDLDVIVGHSTAARELIEQVEGPLDIIVAPVGGGGLISGTALAAHYFSPETTVIGAEPVGADDAYRSLRDGKIYPSENPNTICDGLRTNLGDLNFPIIQQLVDEIILVEDQDTIDALKLIYERMKVITEPSCAITLAAVLRNREIFEGKRVGLILSGGNVDFKFIASLF